MRKLTSSLAVKVVAAGAAVLVVAGGVGLAFWSTSAPSRAVRDYQTRRHALDASVAAARQQGYTPADLAPVTSRMIRLDGTGEPWWLPGRPGYFEGQAQLAGQLQVQLGALERQLTDEARTDGGKQADAAQGSLAQAPQANASD